MSRSEVTLLNKSLVGSGQQKSARYFQPYWLSNSSELLVAEAIAPLQDDIKNTPYSLTTDTLRMPFDSHFRNSLQWRLLKINVDSKAEQQILPPNLIKQISISADSKKLLLLLEDAEQKGEFAGDEYIRHQQYNVLDVDTKNLTPLEFHKFSGADWVESHNLLVSSMGQVEIYNTTTAESEQFDLPATLAANNYIANKNFIAFIQRDKQVDTTINYMIPPPTAQKLGIIDRRSHQYSTYNLPFEFAEIIALYWIPNRNSLLVHSRDLGTMVEDVSLLEVGSSAKPLSLWSAATAVTGISLNLDGSSGVFRVETALGQQKIVSLDLQAGTHSVVYSAGFNSDKMPLSAPVSFNFKDTQGNDRSALIYLPQEHQFGMPTHLIVHAYGRQYDKANTFQLEAQLHTSRGYAYLMPDVFVYRDDIGLAYLETIPSAVATAKKQFGLTGQVGFYGGSLGGFAGLALAAGSKAMDAVAVRAAPTEYAMSWATGKDRDVNLLSFLMSGDTPFSNKAKYDSNSVLWNASSITAPVLILHGENDMQVPVSQGIAMFQALRNFNSEAALRIYPNADHSIIRGNRSYYFDYYQQILAWWQQQFNIQASLGEAVE
jgi:dipeptidyl aminopeptidase/acylaminoacyl peptidase